MPVLQRKHGKVGELRHGVLGSADAVAQSLALLALTFAVSAAPAAAAATAGAAVPVAYVIAGVGSLCLASVIVRFTRRIAHAGGLYTYTVRGLGPQVGFLAGWLYAIAFAVGISFVLIISADFLSTVLTTSTSVRLGWFPLYCILLALILCPGRRLRRHRSGQMGG
jgi:amino acid transporter